MFQFIVWDVDPEIFRIGTWPIRWYGLLFAAGFLLGTQIMIHIFKTEKKPLKSIDPLLVTMMLSTVLGARLGHFLFYEPAVFLQNPLRIITPPFNGLASHGGTIGVLLGIWFYSGRASSRTTGQTFLWLLDRLSIVAVLTGACIRLGNLVNSEIVGTPTTVPWAFIFVRDNQFSPVPRHPAQLYEALSCLALCLILFGCWKAYRNRMAPGTLLGMALVWVFGFRFLWEFFKENQETFEDTMALNMGQLLSIPAILLGLFLLLRNRFSTGTLLPMALIAQCTSLCVQCDGQMAHQPKNQPVKSRSITAHFEPPAAQLASIRDRKNRSV